MTDHDLAASLAALAPHSARRTALEVVYETVRYAILTGALRGGARLVQSSLAESLGVSTTPVREALRDLASEGLVDLDQHRGAVVRTVDADEARKIYELRAILEPVAVRHCIANITDAQLSRLEALYHEMATVTDPRQYVELNILFHGLLLDAAEFPLLSTFLRSLQAKAAIFVGVAIRFEHTDENIGFWPEEIRRGNDEHRRIVELCRRRDADGAAPLMEVHVRSTLEHIERHGLR